MNKIIINNKENSKQANPKPCFFNPKRKGKKNIKMLNIIIYNVLNKIM